MELSESVRRRRRRKQKIAPLFGRATATVTKKENYSTMIHGRPVEAEKKVLCQGYRYTTEPGTCM